MQPNLKAFEQPARDSNTPIVLQCGKASITLLPDGHIILKGTKITEIANHITIDADELDLCPE